MDQVASKFGAPVTKVPAVGNPPISRWEYPGFVVYFEHEHVIHSVVPIRAPMRPRQRRSTAPAAASDAPSPTRRADAPASCADRCAGGECGLRPRILDPSDRVRF